MIRSSKSTVHPNGKSRILVVLFNNNQKYKTEYNEMTEIDLPSLQSIQLGEYALCGSNDESCSLLMRSNNKMM